jgi:hypothetical protein
MGFGLECDRCEWGLDWNRCEWGLDVSKLYRLEAAAATAAEQAATIASTSGTLAEAQAKVSASPVPCHCRPTNPHSVGGTMMVAEPHLLFWKGAFLLDCEDVSTNLSWVKFSLWNVVWGD